MLRRAPYRRPAVPARLVAPVIDLTPRLGVVKVAQLFLEGVRMVGDGWVGAVAEEVDVAAPLLRELVFGERFPGLCHCRRPIERAREICDAVAVEAVVVRRDLVQPRG